jgi:hypothetical protein
MAFPRARRNALSCTATKSANILATLSFRTKRRAFVPLREAEARRAERNLLSVALHTLLSEEALQLAVLARAISKIARM